MGFAFTVPRCVLVPVGSTAVGIARSLTYRATFRDKMDHVVKFCALLLNSFRLLFDVRPDASAAVPAPRRNGKVCYIDGGKPGL